MNHDQSAGSFNLGEELDLLAMLRIHPGCPKQRAKRQHHDLRRMLQNDIQEPGIHPRQTGAPFQFLHRLNFLEATG